MAYPLTIEICPREPRANLCLANGESVIDSDHWQDIQDCAAPGDAEPACSYIRDRIGVDFRIVARNAAGAYENRAATAQEMADTARAIYFDSEADFDDSSVAALYLIWDAACSAVEESRYGDE